MQDSQCTHNVTLRRVRAAIFVAGKAINTTYSECVGNLSYPACSARTPYCHLWPAWFYIISAHYFIKVSIFVKKKKLFKMKNSLLSFLQIFSETFLILRRTERGYVTNVRN